MIVMLMFVQAIKMCPGGVWVHLSIYVRSDSGNTVTLGFNPISEKRIMSPTADKLVVWWIEMLELTTSRFDNSLVLIESRSICVSSSVTASVCQRSRHVSSNTSVSCTWKLSNLDVCVCTFCLFALKESDLFSLILQAIWIWLAAIQSCGESFLLFSSCETEKEPSRFRWLTM